MHESRKKKFIYFFNIIWWDITWDTITLFTASPWTNEHHSFDSSHRFCEWLNGNNYIRRQINIYYVICWVNVQSELVHFYHKHSRRPCSSSNTKSDLVIVSRIFRCRMINAYFLIESRQICSTCCIASWWPFFKWCQAIEWSECCRYTFNLSLFIVSSLWGIIFVLFFCSTCKQNLSRDEKKLCYMDWLISAFAWEKRNSMFTNHRSLVAHVWVYWKKNWILVGKNYRTSRFGLQVMIANVRFITDTWFFRCIF